MKRKLSEYKARIYIVVTIIWIAVIFSFSLQSAETSSRVSSGFGKGLVEFSLPKVAENFEAISMEQIEYFHFLLRKCAHFAEYFILGLLVKMSVQHMEIRCKMWLGILYCILVASMDETIQLFVSGRSGQFSDVVLDSVGALCGMGFLLLIGNIFRRIRQLRTESCM